jgi:hypothetical protein
VPVYVNLRDPGTDIKRGFRARNSAHYNVLWSGPGRETCPPPPA